MNIYPKVWKGNFIALLSSFFSIISAFKNAKVISFDTTVFQKSTNNRVFVFFLKKMQLSLCFSDFLYDSTFYFRVECDFRGKMVQKATHQGVKKLTWISSRILGALT